MYKILFLSLITACYTGNLMATEYFVDPTSSAALWVEKNKSDPRALAIRAKIASVPTAIWLSKIHENETELAQQITSYISQADKQKTQLMFVLYALPNRDCSGQASASNTTNSQKYRTWINQLTKTISNTKLTIILEPDALADMSCLTPLQRKDRTDLLKYAVTQFKIKSPNAHVYLDAGNMKWQPAKTMAEQLIAAGIKDASGFSLNISNYYATEPTIKYGEDINRFLMALIGIKSNMIIDTSRNGHGAPALPNQWCNPLGRKIGEGPKDISATVKTAWIKPPGESDGDFSPTANCHGGPKAGVFSPDLAIRLIKGE
ncbi:glycoside hydrolase family 6 protein [Providencia stuartii]|uniref:Glucanase n=1 Tax=Providencia stuartii (strain MRSN 2154) TaxID=1157951 RepID=A0A140NGR2_PROSM|nr:MULTISPECIES: glycoside hydrolase family 6 protein [Providencia]AFH92305.1 cellobiohydrolase A (1,4-beta-cellobiosidase A) [Providencia stuartii MRSN 2154]MDE8746851.1 glycoside hydrolase family 6 protein [Providencia thailandensis]MDE8765422.1 glycoside hydrolase family 6 protein [Providencia thailandensis]MDE8778826.1 glycoside hydrolase family 6 protein [Providencia thailandensis]MDE8781914.1 glycoside hydrolase family 6 protein [Providencia thailandensis]